jgi:hypothetical protein
MQEMALIEHTILKANQQGRQALVFAMAGKDLSLQSTPQKL